jgi:hypothetical protein
VSELAESRTGILVKLAELEIQMKNQRESFIRHEADEVSHQNTMKAKLDSIDRSIGELELALKRDVKAREAQDEKIFLLLTEERGDRRRATESQVLAHTGGQESLREILQGMLEEERGERREVVGYERGLRTTDLQERREERQGIRRHDDDVRKVSLQIWSQIWEKGGLPIVTGLVVVLLYTLATFAGLDVATLGGK